MTTSEQVLGFHLVIPRCFERFPDLSVFFESDRERSLYNGARRQFEKDGQVDIFSLAQALGGNGSFSYVSGLTNGIQAGNPAYADGAVARLMADKIRKDLNREFSARMKEPEADFAYVRELMEELERLQAAGWGEGGPLPVLIRLSEVESRPVKWLWENRIARGKINLIGGDPGRGKSYLFHDLAARISTGREAPCTGSQFPVGSVLLLSAEDGLADTIRPRLDLLGADCSKIIALDAIKERGRQRTFSLASNLAVLERVVGAHDDMQLVVIDPFTSFLEGRDANASKDTRAITDPLSRMAEASGAAVAMIGHLNKAETMQRAIHRFSGSKDWIAASRTAWLVDDDPNDPLEERRLFVAVKNNLCKRPPTISFRISVNGISDYAISTEDQRADDVLQAKPGERSELRRAEAWIREKLAGGRIPATEIFDDAQQGGLSERTIRRAAKQVKVQYLRDESHRSYWALQE